MVFQDFGGFVEGPAALGEEVVVAFFGGLLGFGFCGGFWGVGVLRADAEEFFEVTGCECVDVVWAIPQDFAGEVFGDCGEAFGDFGNGAESF